MLDKKLEDKELIKHLDSLEEDKLRIFTMADGRIRGALFHGTRFVNKIRVQQNLGILESYILGHAALCSALTIPMMKDMEHTTIKFEGLGNCDGYSVEADSSGYVRGYIYNDRIPLDKPLDSWDLKPFLGPGNLTFSRVHKDDKMPQSSTVDVEGSSIAKDFATYFAVSEQINTAFNSSIQFDKQGRITGAGSMYLQIMPKTGGTAGSGEGVDSRQENSEDEEKMIQKVINAFKACPSLGLLYSEKEVDSEDIILGLFREFNPVILLKRDIKFDCPCSENGFINYLRTLPAAQIEDIKKNGPDPLEIICKNCGSVYHIPISKI